MPNTISIGIDANRTGGLTNSNTIVISALGSNTTLNSISSSSFYVAPIRGNAINVSTLNYNTITKEITYGEPQTLFRFGTATCDSVGAASVVISPPFPNAITSVNCTYSNYTTPSAPIITDTWTTSGFNVTTGSDSAVFSWLATGY